MASTSVPSAAALAFALYAIATSYARETFLVYYMSWIGSLNFRNAQQLATACGTHVPRHTHRPHIRGDQGRDAGGREEHEQEQEQTRTRTRTRRGSRTRRTRTRKTRTKKQLHQVTHHAERGPEGGAGQPDLAIPDRRCHYLLTHPLHLNSRRLPHWGGHAAQIN